MKLHSPATSSFYNTFTAYGDEFVEINAQRHDSSLILLPEGPVHAWAARGFAMLSAEHFAAIAELAPEVVVFGSGPILRFPHPRLTAELAKRRIGIETMDRNAACRTYNILMAEGRKVAAALLFDAAPAGQH